MAAAAVVGPDFSHLQAGQMMCPQRMHAFCHWPLRVLQPVVQQRQYVDIVAFFFLGFRMMGEIEFGPKGRFSDFGVLLGGVEIDEDVVGH